jgi:dolichyl-phosphate beta-glucosyltransferase
MHPDTTIVIAAYNEENRLPESLRKIEAYRKATGVEAEIVVVDDGSTDGTAAVVRLMSEEMTRLRLIRYDENKGKGYALRTGVLASTGREVLVTDADLSTPIEELDTLRWHLSSQSHDIAIGSRGMGDSEIIVAQPHWRRGMGQLFSRLVRLLVLDDFKDTQCGFKLFAGDVARKLFKEARVDRFAYDVEILALAKKNGYSVAEVPITWKNSAASKVSPLVDSLQMVADLIRIRIRLQEEQDGCAAPLESLIADVMPRKRPRNRVVKAD